MRSFRVFCKTGITPKWGRGKRSKGRYLGENDVADTSASCEKENLSLYK